MVVLPVTEDLRTSYETASILARVESKQGTGQEGKLRSHQAVFTLANLFFCGYLDQFVRADSGTHYLSLFIGVEAAVSALFTMAYFTTSAKDILEKTTGFPVSPQSRFLFILQSSIRRPLFLGFYFTTCFFFVVFFWKTRLVMLWAILLYSLMIFNVQLVISILTVFSRKISFAGAGVTFLFIAFIFITGSILFQQDLLFGGFPLIQWVVNGIVAAQSDDLPHAMIYLDVMAGMMLAGLFIGLRMVKE